MSALVAFSTCPDAASAARIARALVEAGLAACVNRVAGVTSTWRWQGTIDEADEVLLVIKTDEAHYPALAQRLRELHPYEVPELIAWPVAHGDPDYLGWLAAALKRNEAAPNGS